MRPCQLWNQKTLPGSPSNQGSANQQGIMRPVFLACKLVIPDYKPSSLKKGEKECSPVSGNPFSGCFEAGGLVIDFPDSKIDRSQLFPAGLKLHTMPGTHAFVQLR